MKETKNSKLGYAVCRLEGRKGEGESVFVVEHDGVASTREAEKFVRDHGYDGTTYVIVKVTRRLEVETFQKRRVHIL